MPVTTQARTCCALARDRRAGTHAVRREMQVWTGSRAARRRRPGGPSPRQVGQGTCRRRTEPPGRSRGSLPQQARVNSKPQPSSCSGAALRNFHNGCRGITGAGCPGERAGNLGPRPEALRARCPPGRMASPCDAAVRRAWRSPLRASRSGAGNPPGFSLAVLCRRMSGNMDSRIISGRFR